MKSDRIRKAVLIGGVATASWLVFQAVLPVGTPLGIVVQGVVVGGLSGLLAVGIVLVYRTNRILSFAQGEMGAVAAVCFVLLQAKAGVPWLVALAAGLIVGGVVGAVVELTIIRRFEHSPRLLPTVATIGVAQLLGATTLLLPLAFGEPPDISLFRTPLSSWSFQISGVPFDGNHVLVLVVVAIVASSLGWFFTRTRYGVAIRAAAENSERAALCGVPTRRLSTLVWLLAGVLSGLAVILQAPIVGFSFGALIGPALLLRALAAAVIGRMQSLPVTVAAAIGLGVFEQATFWAYGRITVVDALLVLVILVGLFARRSTVSRAERGGGLQFAGVAAVRPIPAVLRALPEVLAAKVGLALVGLAVVIWIPAQLSVSRVSLVAVVVIYAIVALSLVVLTGWAGQISLGQFALVAVGAGASGTVSGEAGLDFVLSVFVGGLAGVVAAVLLGLPALRLSGFFLAVTTLAFAVATHSWLLKQRWFAPDGIVERPVLFGRIDLESEYAYYYMCLAVFVIVVIMLRGLRASRVGRAIVTVRDNPEAAQSYGVNVVLAKLSAFAISGAVAGTAGALLVHQQHRLQADQYLPFESLQAFSMTVIGGLGSIPGALAGAIFVRGAKDILRGDYALLATGAGLTFVLLVLPRGLGSLIFDARDAWLRRLANRKGIIVASLLADVGVDRTPSGTDGISKPEISEPEMESVS